MARLNISTHSFAIIPDNIFFSDNSYNIIFQYRWMASAPIETSSIKSVIIYADSPGLNYGQADELGSSKYVDDSVLKIKDYMLKLNPNASLNKVGLSAFSGGGIGFYNLFKSFNKINTKFDAIIAADATYGGNPVVNTWVAAINGTLKNNGAKVVILHTNSLAANFDSTTKTTQKILEALDIKYSFAINSLFKTLGIPILNIAVKDNFIAMETDASHGEAGRSVPNIIDTFLHDWNK